MQTINKFQDEEDVIDLLELFHVLFRKWWLILLCLIIGAGGAGAYTKYMVTPMYKTSASLYILTKTTSVTSLADLQIGTQLTNDFQVIATSRPVVADAITAVANETGTTYSYDDFVSYVSVTNASDTRILTISVTHADPQMAAVMANSLASSTADHMATIMDTDRPTTVEDAIVPENPVSPSLKKNIAIGGIAAAFVICAILVIIYLLDDTIHNEEDITKYLGLDTIAVFPVDAVVTKESQKLHKETKKRHKKK